MSAASSIAVVFLTIGTSATLGLSHLQGWGGFGQSNQSMPSSELCEAPVQAVAWSSGIGAKSLAHTKVLVSWSQKAGQHGNLYASWHNAQNPNINCRTLHHNDVKCVAKGRPCQPEAEAELDLVF